MKTLVSLLLCIFLFGRLSVKGQNENEFNRFETSAHLGIGTPVLDDGAGYYVSLNPVFRVTKWFGIQAELNHIYAPNLTPFLWGEVKREKVTSINAGIQLRTLPGQSNVFFSFNGAVGHAWSRGLDGLTIVDSYSGLSGTAWINMHIKSFTLGIGGAHRYFTARVGYTLKEKPHQ